MFWHWNDTGLKVGKFMSVQNQEEHICHVKQLKSGNLMSGSLFSATTIDSMHAALSSTKVKT